MIIHGRFCLVDLQPRQRESNEPSRLNCWQDTMEWVVVVMVVMYVMMIVVNVVMVVVIVVAA